MSETLTRADAAWLHAEVATNHFVVTSVILLDAPADLDRVIDLMRRRLPSYPRMRQIAREASGPAGRPRWELPAEFDVRAHVHHVGLPAPGGRRELEQFVGDLAGRALDFERPLWELHVVDGPGEGGALVSRVHHALGDGQALVKILLALTDRTPGGWRRDLAGGSAVGRAAGRLEQLLRLPELVAHAPALVAHAPALVAQAPELPEAAGRALELAATVGRLTIMEPDPRTPLRGELTLLKRVAWTRPIPLPRVKRVAHAAKATVNDVMVSSIAGGLGAYLAADDGDVHHLVIRAMVPVNLRAPDDQGTSENRFSLVYLQLPVGLHSPRERLRRVQREMNRIKASREAEAGWLLLRALGFAPPVVEQLVSRFYAAKASLVITNVIGPRGPVYIAGRRVTEMSFWEPQTGGLGVGVSIFSYANSVTVGVIADQGLVPDPQRICAAVEASFAELAAEFAPAGGGRNSDGHRNS